MAVFFQQWILGQIIFSDKARCFHRFWTFHRSSFGWLTLGCPESWTISTRLCLNFQFSLVNLLISHTFWGDEPSNTNQQAAWNPPRSGPNDGDWGYSASLFQLCLQCQRSGWKVHGQGVDGMGWKIHGTELYQFSQVKFTVNSTTNNTTHIDVHSEQFGEQKPTKKNLPSGFARSFTKLCRDCGLYVTQIYSDDWALPYNLGKSDMAKGNPPLSNGKIIETWIWE